VLVNFHEREMRPHRQLDARHVAVLEAGAIEVADVAEVAVHDVAGIIAPLAMAEHVADELAMKGAAVEDRGTPPVFMFERHLPANLAVLESGVHNGEIARRYAPHDHAIAKGTTHQAYPTIVCSKLDGLVFNHGVSDVFRHGVSTHLGGNLM